MTRPQKPNIRRIAFKKQCFEELETYLEEREMHLGHKEFLLDLAALVDFLETENYVGAHYLGRVIEEKLKSKLPHWERLANRFVPEDWETLDVQLEPEN
jgi:hypothetical protein